ncbi:MAG: hypothetical protein ACON35_02215 [Candidatus Marinamargulisbacteria bacterium]
MPPISDASLMPSSRLNSNSTRLLSLFNVDQAYPVVSRKVEVKLPKSIGTNDSEKDYYPKTVDVGFYRFVQISSARDQCFSTAEFDSKKKECDAEGSFYKFYNEKNNEIHKGMYLEYLLPMITLYESCTVAQYKQMDDFLMPIWVFNKLTAKHILTKDEISNYVNCILNSENDDNVIADLATKYCEHNGIDIRREDYNKKRDSIKQKYTENRANMRKAFLVAINGFKGLTSGTDINYSNYFDRSNDRSSLTHSAKLFLEFFEGCINEKTDESLENRTNSGGCKLMVQAVANILGLADSDDLIGALKPINDDLDRTPFMQDLKDLLQFQGEANVIFNDAISLYKEVKKKECGGPVFETEEESVVWLKDKLKNYQTKINEFTDLITELLKNLNASIKKSDTDREAFSKVERYIKLIAAGLSGVPLWSCFLTHRYYLKSTDEGAEIGMDDIKTTVDFFKSTNNV